MPQAQAQPQALSATVPILDRQQLHTIRDRILNQLKQGKQSAVGKALDLFIRELNP